MVNRLKTRWLALAGVGLGLTAGSAGMIACGDDTSEPPTGDGGADASHDATTDTTIDGAVPPPDSGTDARDAGVADGSDAGCASPKTTCSNLCVDLTTDPANCGTCGTNCGTGNTCVGGKCGNLVTRVAAGEDVACIVRVDGTVWCWGSNQYGELGSAPTGAVGACGAGSECSSSPHKIPGFTDAIDVTVGTRYACATKSDNTLWCWGRNDVGQLGHDPSTDPKCLSEGSSPVTVPCSPTPKQVTFPAGVQIARASAGTLFACARTRGTALDAGAYAGDVYCWGENSQGEVGLGNDAGTLIVVPNKVSGFQGDVVDLYAALGGRNACAVREDGSVWCWGANFQGRIGVPVGTGTDCPTALGNICNPTPVQVKVQADAGSDAGDIGLGAALTSTVSVRTGSGSTCALKADGTVWCWGDDGWGIFADPAPYDLSLQHPGARQVPGLAVKALEYHYITGYGIDSNGALFTWGQNTFGQSGNGSVTAGVPCPSDSDGGRCTVPPAATPALAGLVQIAAGVSFALGLKADGSVVSWGRNDWAQLGHDPRTGGDLSTCGEAEPTLVLGTCNPTPAKVTLP